LFGDSSTAGTACKAGLYTGTFYGTYKSALGLGGNSPVAGAIKMTLEENSTGGEVPVYTIQNGTITGNADVGIAFSCTMTGTLDCAETKLVDGGLDCTYCLQLLAAGQCTPGLGGSCKGTIGGNYDLTSYSFVDGTWKCSESFGFGGSGTWTAASALPDGGTNNNGDP
jgi:hypothetical protein